MGKITKDKLPFINFKKTSAQGDQKVHQLRASSLELFPYECEGTGWGDPTGLQKLFAKDYLEEIVNLHLTGLDLTDYNFKNLFLFKIVFTPYTTDDFVGDSLPFKTFGFEGIDYKRNALEFYLPPLSSIFEIEYNHFWETFNIHLFTTPLDHWDIQLHLIKFNDYNFTKFKL